RGRGGGARVGGGWRVRGGRAAAGEAGAAKQGETEGLRSHPFSSRDGVSARCEELAAAREPAEVGLGLAEGRFVRHASRDRGARAPIFLVDQGEIAPVLGLLPVELRADGIRPVALRREEAAEYLVTDRWGPGRAAGQPEAKGGVGAIGQTKSAAGTGALPLVAPGDQPAPLEVVQQLVDLSDVGMPERPEALSEALQQLISVRFAVGQQREQRVA